jgi:hypothetical protein
MMDKARRPYHAGQLNSHEKAMAIKNTKSAKKNLNRDDVELRPYPTDAVERILTGATDEGSAVQSVMDSMKNICVEELMLLVTETGAPVPRTGLPIGFHTPELRFVVHSSW